MDVRAPEQLATIFVDLDGTLIRTDLLWESFFQTLRSDPVALIGLPGWLLSGKARLKHELAKRADLDVALLPYRQEVIEYLRVERAKGRRIVLATGANRKFAEAIADHLGLFDEVMSSDEATNLTAERKLARIAARSDGTDYAYLGNCHEDLCLLSAAAEPIVVAPDRAASRWQRKSGAHRIDDPIAAKIKAGIKAMRPHQWMKNTLIFVPMVLTLEVFNEEMLAAAILAFVSFSLAASSIYLINDLLDLQTDRRHRTKRRRPFASGTLSLRAGAWMVGGLALGSVAIAVLLPVEFQLVLALYIAMTTAYSLAIKRMLLIDVLTLASLYTVRIFAGAAACDIAPSFWLLAFSIFFFLSLALVKRYTELQDQGPAAHRSITGRGYVAADLETLSQAGMASGFSSVLVLAFYVNSWEIRQTYSSPDVIWVLCPLVLYIIVRIWVLARREEMHEDPVVFILRDWRSQLMIGLGGTVFAAAAFL